MLPNGAERREKWISILEIDRQKISTYTKICKGHFKDEDFKNSRPYKTAIPSLNTPVGHFQSFHYKF